LQGIPRVGKSSCLGGGDGNDFQAGHALLAFAEFSFRLGAAAVFLYRAIVFRPESGVLDWQTFAFA